MPRVGPALPDRPRPSVSAPLLLLPAVAEALRCMPLLAWRCCCCPSDTWPPAAASFERSSVASPSSTWTVVGCGCGGAGGEEADADAVGDGAGRATFEARPRVDWACTCTRVQEQVWASGWVSCYYDLKIALKWLLSLSTVHRQTTGSGHEPCCWTKMRRTGGSSTGLVW